MLFLAGLELTCRRGVSFAAASLVLGLQMCTSFTERYCVPGSAWNPRCGHASVGELSHDSLRQATTLFQPQTGEQGYRQVNLSDATQLTRLTRICYHHLVTQGLQILKAR